MKVAVIDVGGTFIKYACMNGDFEILSHGKVPTPMSGREEFLDTILDIYNSMPEAEGIALSLPGIINSMRGYCITSGNLKYNDNFYIISALRKKCKNIKVSIENDAKCAAIAEMKLGSLKDVNDGFVMIFGTGIGSAFFKDRNIHYGRHFSSGEISFIITDKDGSINPSDIFGEQCSTRGLCTMYAEAKNIPVEEVDGERVFEAVNNGEKIAIKCLDTLTRRIAVQISNIQMILDPERFAIGGGISAQPIFIEYIRKNLKKLNRKCKFKLPRAEVVVCEFQNDANLIGALICYLEKYEF